MVANSSENDGVRRSSGMLPSLEICDDNFIVLSYTVRVHGVKQCENSRVQRTVQTRALTRALTSASGVDNVEASSGECVGFEGSTRYLKISVLAFNSQSLWDQAIH